MLKILRGILKSMAEFKQVDILHRDIKTDNILIKELQGEYDIKICDFGLATINGH